MVHFSDHVRNIHRHHFRAPASYNLIICSAFVFLISATVLTALLQLQKARLGNNDWNAFGRISPQHVLDTDLAGGDEFIIPALLIVNLPQVMISALYMVFNSLFTCMLAGREWSRYAIKRATLRGKCIDVFVLRKTPRTKTKL